MKQLHPFRFLVATLLITAAPLLSEAQNFVGGGSGQPLDLNTPGLTFDSVNRYVLAHADPADSGEGGSLAEWGRMARLWQSRALRNDSPGTNMFEQYFNATRLAATARIAGNCAGNSGAFAGNWTCIGPDSLPSQQLGRLKDIWAAPNNPYCLLTAGFGGVWKSRDGGHNWWCITDNTPVSRGIVSPISIAVNPTDTQNIYLGSNVDGWRGKVFKGFGWFSYGNGLLSTTNGGTTWTQEFFPFHTPAQWVDSVHPANVWFSSNGKRIYASRDTALYFKRQGGTWQAITPVSIMHGTGYNWTDVKFVPDNSGGFDSTHFFLASTSGQLIEAVYNPSTGQHTFTDRPLPTPWVSYYHFCIPTSNMIYISSWDSAGGAAGPVNLWRYNITTHQWKFITQVAGVNGLDAWEGGFEASRANPAVVYFTSNSDLAYMSADTGHTTTAISTYFADLSNGDQTHGDVRKVFIQSSSAVANGRDDWVFFACDGGVFVKTPGVNPIITGNKSCININGKGLSCGQFIGLNSTEMGGILLTAQADNSLQSYEPKLNPKWLEINIDWDGGETIIKRTEKRGYAAHAGSVRSDAIDTVTSVHGRTFDTASDVASLNDTHDIITPTWADQKGGAFWAQAHMWEVPPNRDTFVQVSAGSVLPAYPGYDINLNEHTDANHNIISIRSIALSQYLDSLTGYVMYADGALFYRNYYTYVGPSQNRNKFNSRLSCQTFLNTLPPIDMTCNPKKPEQVWVAVGALSWSMNNQAYKRVIYSPNSGYSWFDVSNGLPNHIPVTRVIYQEGSSYVYAATDVGIYRADMSTFDTSGGASGAYNSVQWTCFNRGAAGQHDFPMTTVTQLHINYCEGKLYAATYGRAIWSTDLQVSNSSVANPVLGDRIPDQTEIITANTTWSSDRTIYTGIRVKPGYTLTIKNTSGKPQTVLRMPKNGAIVVEPGAKLVVDGAKITNECGGFWKGILVEGNPGQPQTPSTNQGEADIINGAVIEHARIGVGNYGESVEVNPAATSGGIIYVSGATIRNCARSIGFYPYHNKVGSVIKDNTSVIQASTLIVDSNYRGESLNYAFQAHISMSNVDGIYIAGNTFLNVSNRPNTVNTGQGIISWDGSFNVVPYCGAPRWLGCSSPSSYVHNTFQGFNIAIYSNNGMIDALDYCYVDYADFINNGIGLYAKYNHWCQVFHNNFTMDRNGWPYNTRCNCQKGIWLYESDQFRVEENGFNNIASGKYNTNVYTYGSFIDSCGANVNDHYRNTFTGLNFGIYSYGKNAQLTTYPDSTSIGFQASCNTFNFNNGNNQLCGIPIEIRGPNYGRSIGIRSSQGSMGRPVENKFNPAFQPYSPTTNNWNQFDNWGQSINYYYGGASNTKIDQRPHAGTVNSYQYPKVTSALNSCPMRTIHTAFGGQCYGCLQSSQWSFNNAATTLSLAGISLKTKIDRGGTQNLLSAIDAGIYGAALADTLQAIAPFLSGAVLREAVSTGSVPNQRMLGILAACPDMLDEDMYQFLTTTGPTPYSPSDISFLSAHQTDTSARTAMIGAVNDAYADMSLAHQDIIATLMLDSNGLNVDTLIYWYHKFPAPWARYHEAFIRLGQQDYSGAQATLSSVGDEFNLSSDETDVLSTYKDIVSLLTGTLQSGRTELMLDSGELATLSNYAALSHGSASNYAQNLYNQNLGIIPLPCDAGSTDSNGNNNAPPIRSGHNGIAASTLNRQETGVTAYPNPSHGDVTFSYNLPNAGALLTLVVTTVDGKAIWSAPLPGNRGMIRWAASNAAPGVYLYKIIGGDQTLANGKVTIER